MFIAVKGGLILNVLNNKQLSLIKYPPSLNYHITFKGHDSQKDKDIPTRLYITVHYSITTATTLPLLISYNINSIYTFKTSLTAICQGICQYPDRYNNKNIITNVYLNIPILIIPDLPLKEQVPIPLHHILYYSLK